MINKIISIILFLIVILLFKLSYNHLKNEVDDRDYTTVLNYAGAGLLILIFAIGFLTTKVLFCEAYPKFCNKLTIG